MSPTVPNTPNIPNVLVEIRSGEGGDDAKLLVRDYVAILAKCCTLDGL